ncbi:MAG: transporter [Flavobacteriaceae bacterium]
MHKSFPHILGVLLSILMLSVVKAQYTEVINSNRPSQSMGAFSVGKNVYQWEQGISFRHGDFNTFQNASFIGLGTRMQLRVGLFKEQLEVVGTMDYQLDELSYQNALGKITVDRKGLRDFSVGAKYLVYDPFRNTEKYKPNLYSYHANNRVRWRDLIPAVSVYAATQFATGGIYPYQEPFYPLFNFDYRPIEEPTVSVTGMIILQQHLKPGLVLVHNIGMRYITANIQQKKLIGTLTYSTRDKLSFYGEYQIDDSPLYRDVTLGAGVAYLLSDDLQLDIALQHSVKTTPKLLSAGIGVSYRLDKHNIWNGQPQDLKEVKQSRKERKKLFKEENAARKAEKRTNKGLRKLDKKQKRIERKLKKVR